MLCKEKYIYCEVWLHFNCLCGVSESPWVRDRAGCEPALLRAAWGGRPQAPEPERDTGPQSLPSKGCPRCRLWLSLLGASEGPGNSSL